MYNKKNKALKRIIFQTKFKINLLIIIFLSILAVSGFTQVTADFTADINSGCDLLTVHFTNTSSGTGSLEYSWDFGDGDSSNEENPTHIYNVAGSYNVSLAVNNGTDYDTLTLVNYINYFNGPTANLINLTDTLGCIPLFVEFRDSSVAGDTSISGWNWNFDDGNI